MGEPESGVVESTPEGSPGDAAVETSWELEKVLRLDQLLQSVEAKLSDKEFKASVGDFVRLLQLRKEIEEERPREIVVRWVEPSSEEDATAI